MSNSLWELVGNKAKVRIPKRVFQENKPREIVRKTNISFFGKFGALCFLETHVLRFALLPYYRRTTGLIWFDLLEHNLWESEDKWNVNDVLQWSFGVYQKPVLLKIHSTLFINYSWTSSFFTWIIRCMWKTLNDPCEPWFITVTFVSLLLRLFSMTFLVNILFNWWKENLSNNHWFPEICLESHPGVNRDNLLQ